MGSKPELLAVMAVAGNDVPIICNGFKDDEFIEMALLAAKDGPPVSLVVEKYTELEAILRYARQWNVRPMHGHAGEAGRLGLGQVAGSGGYRSKFGLSSPKSSTPWPK